MKRMRWLRDGFVWLVVGITASASQAQDCPLLYVSRVQTIRVSDSVTIAYAEQGNGPIALLFVHGLGGNLTNWRHNLDTLSATYRCVVIDLPGYGMSGLRTYHPATDQMSFYADQVIAFVHKRSLSKVVLVGHSMGGQVAMLAALRQPQAFRGLVLINPAGLETFTEQEGTLLTQVATPQFFQKQTETAIRWGYAQNFTGLPADAETLVQDRLRLRDCPGFTAYCQTVAQGVVGMLAHPVRAQLGQIQQPTLILFGKDDKLIPNRLLHPALTTRAVADIGDTGIPDSRLIMIPQAGHMAMYEQAGAVNKAIQTFVRELN